MNRRNAWHIFLMSTFVSLAGIFTFVVAEEKREIPDHSGFPAETCQACHGEKNDMWSNSNHAKVIRSGVATNTAATGCRTCHSPLMSPAVTSAGKIASSHQASCLACHDPKSTAQPYKLIMASEKLCESCHNQRDVFLGHGAKGIEDSRNFHSGVPCADCHMTEGNHRMKVLRPDDPNLTEKRLDTCTKCHADDNRVARVRQIQEWQSLYDESMKAVKDNIAAVDAELKKNPNALDATLKTKLDDMKANVSLLDKDGSRGFHNLVFSQEITYQANEDLKEIKASLKK